MQDAIFISYSRRDQEFVVKLASDLNQKVAGVWLDQSDLAAGQKWRDQIHQGIQNCKVFILVLSPDAAKSTYVQEEVEGALRLQKTVIPILYRPVRLTGKLAELVHETQFLDLSLGSYADNFQKLVDGLVAAGITRQVTEKPFIFQPIKTDWEAVFYRVPGWGAAWGMGWAAFWLLFIGALALLNTSSGAYGSQGDAASILITTLGGGFGGFVGGVVSGLVTMLALRRYAPSVTWKHMAPAVPIWVISGPVGILLSIMINTILILMGALAVQLPMVDCTGLSVEVCFQQIVPMIPQNQAGVVILGLLGIFIVAMGIWFLVGLFAGWLAVLFLRRLEPGIQRNETMLVSLGWGAGAVVSTFFSLVAITLGTLIAGG